MSYIPFPAYYDDAPIDLRFVYKDEKPAGKRGFVKCVDDHFEFEDGTVARFWGTNFNGGSCFPDKAHAEKIALRLAKIGVNLVRYHQLDAEWDTPNIFALTKGPHCRTTTEFDPEAMDRLDYFTYCLKEQGIYVYMDIFTYRRFKSGDGVPSADLLPDAGKPYCYFNERMIELQKKTIYDFWNHYNPYTKTVNKDDPVFVMGEIVNEADLFVQKVLVEPYVTEFRGLFRKWLDENGLEYDAENGEINEANHWANNYPVLNDFRVYLTKKYYMEIMNYMKEIGVKFPICGTNWYINDRLVESNHVCDFMDSHYYYYDWKWQDHICANTALSRVNGDILTKLVHVRTFDKPLFVSEWDVPWPNAYRAESPIVYAALGSLQNFGGYAIHTYAYSNTHERMDMLGKEMTCDTIGGVRYREGIFSTWNDPAKFGLFYHAALITRRGDVTPLDGVKYGVNATRDENGKFCKALTLAPEKVRIGTAVAGAESVDVVLNHDEMLVKESDGEVRSENGELYRSWEKGYGTIDTARTKCAYGFLGENGKLELDGLSVDCKTDFAVIALSSLTDDALDKTGNILLTAVGRAENTDAKFDGDKMLEYGHAPIITEVIEAEIEFRTNMTNIAIWAVNAEGFYVGRIPVTCENGVAKFTIGDTHKSIYYLIQSE